MNTVGSYDCMCIAGFEGSGFTGNCSSEFCYFLGSFIGGVYSIKFNILLLTTSFSLIVMDASV